MSSSAWPTAGRVPQQATNEGFTANSRRQVPNRVQFGSQFPNPLPPSYTLRRHNNQQGQLTSQPQASICTELKFAATHQSVPRQSHAVRTDPPSREVQIQDNASISSNSLHETFQVRDKSFFEFGRVFRVASHERVGVLNEKDVAFVRPDCWGRPTISKTRISISVEEHKDYCIAVSISSYSDRSVNKKSTNASEHSFARTDSDQSPPSKKHFRRAGQMLREPICIIPEWVQNKRTELRFGSVVDFGKVTSIQHYHEVEPFGFVAPDSLATLWQHYSTVRTRSMAANAPSLNTYRPSLPDARNMFQQESHPRPMFIEDPSDEFTFDPLQDEQNFAIHKYISNAIGAEEERDNSEMNTWFRNQILANPNQIFVSARQISLLGERYEPATWDRDNELIVDRSFGLSRTRRTLWMKPAR